MVMAKPEQNQEVPPKATRVLIPKLPTMNDILFSSGINSSKLKNNQVMEYM